MFCSACSCIATCARGERAIFHYGINTSALFCYHIEKTSYFLFNSIFLYKLLSMGICGGGRKRLLAPLPAATLHYTTPSLRAFLLLVEFWEDLVLGTFSSYHTLSYSSCSSLYLVFIYAGYDGRLILHPFFLFSGLQHAAETVLNRWPLAMDVLLSSSLYVTLCRPISSFFSLLI